MSASPQHTSLVFSGIAPHPPIMVPEVGRSSIGEVRRSIDAMAKLTERVIASGAESVVLISPHAPLEMNSFVVYSGPQLHADFSHFGSDEVNLDVSVDQVLLNAIKRAAAHRNYQVTPLGGADADHGTAVPLYFLLSNNWQGMVVALGYSFLSNEDHLHFGEAIREAVDLVGRRVALIASGDLSHRLKPHAPAGYNSHAYIFDEEVVEALDTNRPDRIVDIDQGLRKLAGECGYRSMLVAIGATRELPRACEVLSYEAPFGVGYLVAQLTRGGNESAERPIEQRLLKDGADDPAIVARNAVERFVREGVAPEWEPTTGLLAERAPCFVSLKTKEGDLRGCIGTIEASKETLAEEITTNAISAATRDPRFSPVGIDELSDLSYSVDILMPAEPAKLEDLDPAIYGVIVEDDSGWRRGLLLPDIPGVRTARQQVEIAARKAGIPPGTPLRLMKFKVERFKEAPDR